MATTALVVLLLVVAAAMAGTAQGNDDALALETYVPFETGDGHDAACPGNELQLVGHADAEAEGRVGGGVHLGGGGAHLFHPNDAGQFDLSTPEWTLQLWARADCDDDRDDEVELLSARDNGGGGDWALLLRPRDGEVAFTGADRDPATAPIPGHGLACGHWLHLVASRCGDQTRVWVDGQPGRGAAQRVHPLLAALPAGPLRAGFRGHADELALWSRCLEPREIAGLHEGGRGRPLVLDVEEPPTPGDCVVYRRGPQRVRVESRGRRVRLCFDCVQVDGGDRSTDAL